MEKFKHVIPLSIILYLFIELYRTILSRIDATHLTFGFVSIKMLFVTYLLIFIALAIFICFTIIGIQMYEKLLLKKNIQQQLFIMKNVKTRVEQIKGGESWNTQY